MNEEILEVLQELRIRVGVDACPCSVNMSACLESYGSENNSLER